MVVPPCADQTLAGPGSARYSGGTGRMSLLLLPSCTEPAQPDRHSRLHRRPELGVKDNPPRPGDRHRHGQAQAAPRGGRRPSCSAGPGGA